jgi:hypothetical protein
MHSFRPVLVAVFALAAMPALAAEKVYVNTDKDGIAIKGHDPVEYFTHNRPAKGDPARTVSYEGATYRFASEENKKLFEENPGKYAPQFGGFCAYAVSKGSTASIDPAAFQIVDGRLLLQNSLAVRDKFNKDAAGNVQKADANWPSLVEKHGR